MRFLPSAAPSERWPRMLHGDVRVSEAARLDGASLAVRDPAGCSLEIAAGSNVAAFLAFEKAEAAIRIGPRTHIGGHTILSCASRIDIGADVLIAFGVFITDHDAHSLSSFDRRNDVRDEIEGRKDWSSVHIAPVSIRDKAWIGARAIILKGVTLGEGAVVGAGSVVTRDVPAWSLAVGNPARVVRRLPEGGQDE